VTDRDCEAAPHTGAEPRPSAEYSRAAAAVYTIAANAAAVGAVTGMLSSETCERQSAGRYYAVSWYLTVSWSVVNSESWPYETGCAGSTHRRSQ